MNKVELDFLKKKPASTWAGWALLFAGIIFWIGFAYSIIKTDRDIRSIESALIKDGTGQMSSPLIQIQQYSPTEYAEAREVIAKIGIPWNELFNEVESVHSDKIVLLAMEPDPKAGTVTLRGAASDMANVLTYVSRLAKSKKLFDVYLLRHEIRQDDPAYPIKFSVGAHWGDRP